MAIYLNSSRLFLSFCLTRIYENINQKIVHDF